MLALLIAATLLADADANPSPDTEPHLPAPSPRQLRFGQQGQIVTSTGISLNGSYNSQSLDGSNSTDVDVGLSPAVDWFVIDDLSLGLGVQFAYYSSSYDGTNMTEITAGVGPRVGYNIQLGNRVSLWPRLILLADYGWSTSTGSTPSQSIELEPELVVPLEFQLVPHVILGIGPFVDVSLYRSISSTSWDPSWGVGVYTSLAAYF